MGNTVTSGRFKKTLIECYQKCCQYCSLYSLENVKNCCQCPRAQKKDCSSHLNQSEEHTLREGNRRQGRGGRQAGGWEGRGRDSLLMSIWWVFSWSRDLFVLLLFPESSIPPLLRKRGIRRCCKVRLVMASCQTQLIGSSRIDPRSFPYLNCDLILLSGPFDIYLNAMHP